MSSYKVVQFVAGKLGKQAPPPGLPLPHSDEFYATALPFTSRHPYGYDVSGVDPYQQYNTYMHLSCI